MPEPAASSWADEIEEGDSSTLPPPSEKVKGDTKVVTEYIFNEDGKKMRVVRTYKIEKKMVPKSVAQRRAWAKFEKISILTDLHSATGWGGGHWSTSTEVSRSENVPELMDWSGSCQIWGQLGRK